LLSWLTTLVFPQLGLLTFVVATSVFSAIANFILSRLSS
jgi:hypothetical protein